MELGEHVDSGGDPLRPAEGRRLRIGTLPYLNARPLVWGFDPVALVRDTPAGLTARMAAGELDLALLPVIALAEIPDLQIVPGIAIGTHGPSRSVLLVAKRPLEAIDSLALDPDSRTSNALAQVLLAERWGRCPELRMGHADLEATLAGADACVRIGDKALFEPLPAGVVTCDLAAEWSAWTGLPFVFALWATRPGVVDRALYRRLHDSRREGLRAARRIAEEFEWRGERHAELAHDYLTRSIRYRLGGAEVAGLRLFFRAAAAAGAIPHAPELRFALGTDSACHETAARLGRR